MNKVKNTYNEIKDFYINEGYTLLSTEYVRATAKLEYICPNGHQRSANFVSFKRGQRCQICSGRKYTINQIKDSFESEGYNLLSKTYEGIYGKLNYICPKGHRHSATWNNWHKHNSRCPTCYREKLGSEHQNSKGNVTKLNLPLYKTYNPQLVKYEQTHLIHQDDLELLGINCLYCNKVFVPKAQSVKHRINSILGKASGENRFYCSDGCKLACPTYKQHYYHKDYKQETSRELQPALRKLVLERDNWTCQKCDKNKDVQLHCHHIDPVISNPIESADINNCITLCKQCHKEAHKLAGCGYSDLKCS